MSEYTSVDPKTRFCRLVKDAVIDEQKGAAMYEVMRQNLKAVNDPDIPAYFFHYLLSAARDEEKHEEWMKRIRDWCEYWTRILV